MNFTYKEALLGFEGEIEDSLGARICGATDNSVFWKLPQAILYPKSSHDLKLLATSPLSLTPRGGFTGTNGQSLNDGLIVDTSRHLNAIHWDSQFVRVEPGVTLDEVNSFLAPKKLFFAPHVSTSSRATLGGMFGTDAAGKGSAKYGRMHQHIESFDWLFPWGEIKTLHEMTYVQLKAFFKEQIDILLREKNSPLSVQNPWLQLQDTVLEFIQNYQEVVQEWPKHPRGLSGYNLKDAWNPTLQTWNWAAFLAGSEGTLGMASSLTLRASPLPQEKVLSLWLFKDLDEYQDVWNTLKGFPSIAVELVDQKILRQARSYWPVCSRELQDALEATPFLFLMEFEKDPAAWDELQSQVPSGVRSELIYAEHEQVAWWNIRAKGVELLSRTKGSARPIAFAEDTVVSPDLMGDYLKELGELLRSYDLEFSLFGHADVGCVHMRPFFDLRQESEVEKMKALELEIFQLVSKYQGTFWGEHGRGLRTQFVTQSFSAQALNYIEKFKHAFDPNGLWNPHKILPSLENFEVEAQRLNSIPSELQDQWHGISHCNGNAACLNHSSPAPMCPSYAVSKDRRQSPKGRALMAREWMRLGDENSSERNQLEVELEESLESCLSCQACTRDCPLEVDIPQFKHQFQTNRRQNLFKSMIQPKAIQAWCWSQGEKWSAALSKSTFGRRLLRTGLTWMGSYQGQMDSWKKLKVLQKAHEKHSANIQLWLDPMSFIFHPQEILKAIEILEYFKIDFKIVPIESLDKIAYKEGFSSWKRQKQKLATLSQSTTTLVIDPSVHFTLKDEYKLKNYEHFSSWLIEQGYLQSEKFTEAQTNPPVQLIPHCHQDSQLLQKLWDQSPMNVQVQKRSCCGQAGDFGWRNPQLSLEIFNHSWQSQYRETDFVCGGSCRGQIERHRLKAQSDLDLILRLINSAE